MTYPQVTTYPERMTIGVMRTKRKMMVENTMRVMVGLARGPNEELTVAMLPLRDLEVKCNIRYRVTQMSIKQC